MLRSSACNVCKGFGTGVERKDVLRAISLKGHKGEFLAKLGFSGTGTDKVNAILHCHLATGRIGRQGMGPFSVTGLPNAMGGREVGAGQYACLPSGHCKP